MNLHSQRTYKKKLSNLSDEEIIRCYLDNLANIAISELYSRYAHLVIGTCMKYLKNLENSEDLTVQIFSELPLDLKKHTIIHFKSWLYTKTKNACFMHLRKKKHVFLDISDFEPISEDEDTLSSKEILEMKLNSLDTAISELNLDQAYCIREFYLNKKSYEEIHSGSSYTMNQIKSHIQNGKRNLKIIITKISII